MSGFSEKLVVILDRYVVVAEVRERLSVRQ
jgi:hypothetical protein